jgi:hypothetical protein
MEPSLQTEIAALMAKRDGPSCRGKRFKGLRKNLSRRIKALREELERSNQRVPSRPADVAASDAEVAAVSDVASASERVSEPVSETAPELRSLADANMSVSAGLLAPPGCPARLGNNHRSMVPVTLSRLPFAARWCERLGMHGSVVYQARVKRDAAGTAAPRTSQECLLLRFDVLHRMATDRDPAERKGAGLRTVCEAQIAVVEAADASLLLASSKAAWRAATLFRPDASAARTLWTLRGADGAAGRIDLGAADLLSLAAYDGDLPFASDPRLARSVRRCDDPDAHGARGAFFSARRARVDKEIAPALPPGVRQSLAHAGVHGEGSLFFSGPAFARHVALTAVPTTALLAHGAFLLQMPEAPFRRTARWACERVETLLEAAERRGRRIFGNVQAQFRDETLAKRPFSGPREVFTGDLARECLPALRKRARERRAACGAPASWVDIAAGRSSESGSGAASTLAGDARCYLHEVRAEDILPLAENLGGGLQGDPCDDGPAARLRLREALNVVAQMRARVGPAFVPFFEKMPKLFAGDPGVCMPGHRDTVSIAESCLQVRFAFAFASEVLSLPFDSPCSIACVCSQQRLRPDRSLGTQTADAFHARCPRPSRSGHPVAE